VGILFLGANLKKIALSQPEPMQLILTVIYFVMPHLEWFDLRDFVVYDQALVSWPALTLATGYAAIWTMIFLVLAWLGFSRKNLTT
jgi:hypothetical protein